jgi:hypothetical protein
MVVVSMWCQTMLVTSTVNTVHARTAGAAGGATVAWGAAGNQERDFGSHTTSTGDNADVVRAAADDLDLDFGSGTASAAATDEATEEWDPDADYGALSRDEYGGFARMRRCLGYVSLTPPTGLVHMVLPTVS